MVAKRFFGIVGAAMLLATSAQAAIHTVTITGVVDSGYDQTGIFGVPDAVLSGLAFTSVYKYDTSLGQRFVDPGVSDNLQGGTNFGISNPVIAASITIAGLKLDYLATYVGVANSNSGSFTMVSYDQDSSDPALFQQHALYNIVELDGLPVGLDIYLPTTAVGGIGLFDLVISENATGTTSLNTYGWLTNQTLTVSGGVPEPQSWELMILGFGMVGATLRRRQVATA
jgi:hypothetical protein